MTTESQFTLKQFLTIGVIQLCGSF